ncbi:lysoplasmalogenase [Tenacibaculum amylolyticum]|uniref:lysoplasmalogenase n=1 Tax=Tenacibaculum amylolyticum TaxID=104269 RepID=UPI003895C600
MKNIPQRITIIALLFLLVSMLEVYGTIMNNKLLEFIFKPLITVVLAILYLVSVKKRSFWFVSALFFSFWGDVLLLFPKKFFIGGLVSFLITHIIYIKIIRGFFTTVKTKTVIYAAIPFVVYFSLIVMLIKENLGELFVPVIVYGIAISTFGTVALLNYIKNKATENSWLLIGALLFILSDSIIAIKEFYFSASILQVLIMITYIVSQYLICKAVIIKHNH